MSQRQAIMTALGTALKGLTKANGYNLDLGRRLVEWPTTAVDQMQLPALMYRDGRASVGVQTEEGQPVSFGQHEHQLTVEVVALVTTPADARKAVEDVTALLWANRKLGGACRWITLSAHQIEQEQADRRQVAAGMTFTISYRTPLGEI
jgi:hypothetical protein